MYASLFRVLPGPTWLKIIQCLILLFLAVAVLFQWVYPWVAQNVPLYDNTVG